nr:hypothetical protein [Flavobacteriales bacterium]
MVQEATDAEVAHHFAELLAAQVALQLAQAVFAQDVEAFALNGAEGAGGELQQQVVIDLVVEVEGAEVGLEGGAFLSFEEHGE